MESIKNIGTLLKELRKSKRLSQIEVAKAANIAVNSLRLYESNKRQPRFEQLMAILDALNATMGDLLRLRPTVDSPENRKALDDGLVAMLETMDAFRADQLHQEINSLFSSLNLDGKEAAVDAVKNIAKQPDFLRTLPSDEERPPEDQ